MVVQSVVRTIVISVGQKSVGGYVPVSTVGRRKMLKVGWLKTPRTGLDSLCALRRGLVVFFRTYSFRFLCGKYLSAGTAAQPFERENGGRQRRLPHNPYQHFRLFLPVYVASFALRATIPVLQLRVRNRNLP